MSCELKAVPVPMAGEKLPISNSRERACLRTCSPREGRMGRCAMFMLLTGLFAVALSLSSTLATAQQVCQKAGDNKGSNDPNAVLNWTLTTHVNTACIAAIGSIPAVMLLFVPSMAR
jgi:hypothetical protein